MTFLPHSIARQFCCTAIVATLSLTTGACFGENDGTTLTPADMAGKRYSEGDATMAPFGKGTKKTSGTILKLYGKLAEIDFTSGKRGWALLKSLDPEGAVSVIGIGDSCRLEVGDKVKAPWGKRKKLYKGSIDEVHGKMAHILFNDGDQDWAPCEAMAKTGGPDPVVPKDVDTKDVDTKVVTKKTDDSSTSSGSSKGCIYRPKTGRYVECQSFASGKCIAGARRCKPREKCVFSPKKGKYVKCSSFSQGKCLSGSIACKPRNKCVYSPKKGKHVKCSTFSKGVCKSGARACKPT